MCVWRGGREKGEREREREREKISLRERESERRNTTGAVGIHKHDMAMNAL